MNLTLRSVIAVVITGLMASGPSLLPMSQADERPPGTAATSSAWSLRESGSSDGEDPPLDLGEFMAFDRSVVDRAMAVETTADSTVQVVDQPSELYGSRDFPVANEAVAKMFVIQELGLDVVSFQDLGIVTLSGPLSLLDARGQHVFNAYDYEVPSTGETGIAVVAVHTRAPLMKELRRGVSLPETSSAYYLSEGEFYFRAGSGWQLLDGRSVTGDEMKSLLTTRQKALAKMPVDVLVDLEVDSISMLNNLAYLFSAETADLALTGTHYGGTDTNATGYGGIYNIPTYLSSRYKATVSSSSGKVISMQNFTMADLSKGGICVPAAVTRILLYWRSKGWTKIPANRGDVYRRVLAIAKNHGWTSSDGVWPTAVDNIAQEALRYYGYKGSTGSNVYVWNFNTVKSEATAGRPVIMNIARGYYGNHSVTANGWRTYATNKKSYNFVAVYDGWARGQRYIDYGAFAYDLISSGFGSFTYVRPKR